MYNKNRQLNLRIFLKILANTKILIDKDVVNLFLILECLEWFQINIVAPRNMFYK